MKPPAPSLCASEVCPGTAAVRRALCAIFLLSCLPALRPVEARAEGPWYVAYERALTAQEQSDWAGSIRLLKEALALKDHPKLKAKTYGLQFINYLPYFQMGLAYYHLKDKQKALENFDLCLKYGEIQNAPEEYARLQSLRRDLTGEPPPSAAEAERTATAVAADVSPPSEVSGLPWYVNYESALAYIESGDWFKAVENLKLSLAANGVPRRYARTYGMWFVTYIPYYYLGLAYYNQKLWQLAVNYFEISQRLGEVDGLDPEAANLRTLLDDAKKRTPGSARRSSSEEVNGVLSTLIAEAVRLFNQEDYAEAEARFKAVLQLDPYNSVARTYLARSAAMQKDSVSENPPPAEYSKGVLQLLRGRHEQAIKLLSSAESVMDQDASLHGYLGVAYALRYRASKKKDAAALRSARLEFRRALSLDPSYTLDGSVFSRDVMEVFRSAPKSE